VPTPDPALALKAHAEQLLAQGRVAEALAAHEQLLAQRPAWADPWYNLGYLQNAARRYEAALASYARALDLGAAGPEEIHLNRAVILAERLGRTDDAERELRLALARAPRYLPALVNLGNLYEQRGQRREAHEAYARVLEVDPRHALALARLANVAPLANPADPLIQRLRIALAEPGRSAAEQADLGFGLGKSLDAVAAYDEAFAAYTAANAANRASAGPHAPRYDRAGHERFVDALIRGFSSPAPKVDDEQRTPVFICGMFRSGSTLIEQIMASHPRVTAGGEIDLVPAIAAQHLPRWLRTPGGPIDDGEWRALAAQYRAEVQSRFPTAEVLTDKRPDNFLHIGLIKRLFPNAKIVHTVREPLDNCLSVYFLHLSAAMPYAHALDDIAHWHRQYRRLMAHWKALYADDIHDVHYDALVTDPRPAIEGVLAHCGLDWHEGCLEFHRTPSVIATPSAWQVRRPLYTASSGRWRHYERHLGGLRAALADAPS
jgi:tetratricopeptide (TPR) repeat protein